MNNKNLEGATKGLDCLVILERGAFNVVTLWKSFELEEFYGQRK
jgi:hypothetical protein